jgi:hypothetical protein
MAPIVQTIDFGMGAALKYHRWVKHNEALWGHNLARDNSVADCSGNRARSERRP